MNVWGIILAAGQSSRLAKAGCATKKQFLAWSGLPLFWHSAKTFSRIPQIMGLIFVFPYQEYDDALNMVTHLTETEDLGIPWTAVLGGERRQDSVRHGLAALPSECDHILVHDAARPFSSPSLIQGVLQLLSQGKEAVVPSLAVTDTIKRIQDGIVQETLDRSQLGAVQTPQGFRRSTLEKAHNQAVVQHWEGTDDASLVERLGTPVWISPGDINNLKITTPEDLVRLAEPAPEMLPCSGWGYDVHAFGGDRPMILGGIPIPGGPMIRAHSDGDVLLHALCDAILGCLGQGDIGQHWPDSDPALAGMSSGIFLSEVMDMTRRNGLRITHVDLTVIAQIPRLAPWRDQIRKNISSIMSLNLSQVNVKATTEEGLGFTGEKLGIKAVALVSGLRYLKDGSSPWKQS